MNAPAKIVPKSKLSEWRGLDRIGLIVHGMRCIWREQEKDDIGVDGEIELCRPRTDGDGLIGTGKIVKVQSKSGSSYVVRDTDQSFASPTTEKDLLYWRDLNVPVVFIVFHPDDDRLYWKDVKRYLAARPDALSPPHRIEFDKTADRFDEDAYQALCGLCDTAPERVSQEQGELLYTNLLEVLDLPERIWVTPVLPEKRPRFHDRLTSVIPPYVFKNGNVVTLTDPTASPTALADALRRGKVIVEEQRAAAMNGTTKLKSKLKWVLYGEMGGPFSSLLRCRCTASLVAGVGRQAVDPVFSGYVVGRLGMATRASVLLLDGLELRAAVRAAELLGTAAEAKAAVKPRWAGDHLRRVREAGMTIAADWPAAFERVLDGLAGVRRPSDPDGLIGAYGWVYSELAAEPADGFAAAVAAVLRNHAVRVGPQVTAQELALELRCSRERIVATGRMIDPDATGLGGAGPLPPTLAVEVRSLLANCGTTRQVMSRLGLSQPQLVRLLGADDRDRVPKPIKQGADLFRMEPLQAFLDGATANAAAYNDTPPGMVPLMKVGSLNRRWPDAYKAMRNGTLRATGTLIGQVGLNAILLGIADVRDALSLEIGEVPTLSVSDAIVRLRLSAATLAALRRAKLLVYASHPGKDRATQGRPWSRSSVSRGATCRFTSLPR